MRNHRGCNEPYNGKDEFLLETSDEDADAAGALACECYEWASNQIFDWYKKNEGLFPNQGAPDFAFNLDGGFKKGVTYLSTH